MSSDQEPTLTQLLQNAFRSQMLDVHTSVPCKVVEYKPKEGKVDVEIGIKRKYFGETATPYPIIPDVPIRFQRSAGGQAFMRFPIKKGDTGLLTFSERSIEKWLISKDSVDPDDPRIFDISDATFSNDLVQDHLAEMKDEDSVEIGYGEMSMVLWPDGKIEFKGASEDFMSLFVDLISEMIDATVVTSLGASPFTAITIAKLQELKSKAETLKK